MQKFLRSLVPLFLYMGLSLLYFGLHLHPDFSHQFFGMSGDVMSAIWVLKWWAYALTHGVNPFITHYLWAPVGFNLTQTLPMPLLNTLLVPFVLGFGAIATYNFAAILMSALSAYAAYFLCRYLTKSFWIALFGGYLFGFSSYQIAQSLAHICLTATFLIPLLLLVTMLFFHKRLTTFRFVLFFALLLTGEFLINTETYVVIGLFFGLFTILAYFIYSENRKEIILFAGYVVLSFLFSAVLVSPYIYAFLVHHAVSYQKDIINYGSMDLFNLFIPSTITWLGGNFFLPIVSRHFHVNLFLSGAYLGLPLIMIMILYFKEFWHQKITKLLFWMLIILIVAALGPILHWRGHKLVHLPWAIVSYIPILKAIIPARFALYISLLSAVIAVLWLKNSRKSLLVKSLLACLTVIFLLPNPYPANAQWTTKLHIPQFIQNKTYKKVFPKNAILVTLPYNEDAACEPMVWQVKSNMYFRLAGGCTGGTPRRFLNIPGFHALQAGEVSKISPLQFKKFLRIVGASGVVIKESLYHKWKPLLSRLGVPSVHSGGVVYFLLH